MARLPLLEAPRVGSTCASESASPTPGLPLLEAPHVGERILGPADRGMGRSSRTFTDASIPSSPRRFARAHARVERRMAAADPHLMRRLVGLWMRPRAR